MKIVQIVPYFYPAWAYGGPAKLVYDTSLYFSSKGHQVTVITSDAYDRVHRMPQSLRLHNLPNLTVRYFRNAVNYLAYTYNIFFTPGMYGQVIPDIRRADVVHIHDFYTAQNVWIGLLCFMFKTPYILSVHGCLEEKRMAQRSLFKSIFLSLFGRSLLLNASYVIATSDNEIRAYKLSGIQSKKIMMVGHGVSLNEFISSLSKEASRAKLHLPPKIPIITFLGRIHKIKGLNLLVAAIEMLKSKKLHFVIAGSDDGYLQTLKQDIQKRKLSKHITLMATCFGEKKAQLFKASDIFVYPSYSEGFSLGILEAAAAGLPLVLSEGCHFPLVAKKKAGIIVKADASEIATAIMKFVDNNTLKISTGLQAKKLVETYYSMSVIGDKLLKIYSQAAQ